jgi:hypothetical protein
MSDLLGSLIWGAKSGKYCVIGGESLQMVSESACMGWAFASAHLMTQFFFFFLNWIRPLWFPDWAVLDLLHWAGMDQPT